MYVGLRHTELLSASLRTGSGSLHQTRFAGQTIRRPNRQIPLDWHLHVSVECGSCSDCTHWQEQLLFKDIPCSIALQTPSNKIKWTN